MSSSSILPFERASGNPPMHFEVVELVTFFKDAFYLGNKYMRVCSGAEENDYSMSHFSFKRPKNILEEIKKLPLPMIYLLKKLIKKIVFDISC